MSKNALNRGAREDEDATPHPSAILPEWRLALRLRDCYRAFNIVLQSRLDPYGMRTSDWAHLRVIADEEGLTQVEISSQLRIGKASSTAVLAKLKSAGLIHGKQRESDHRKIGIYLTRKGKGLMEQLIPEVLSVINLATDSISDGEMSRFVTTISKITTNLEARQEER